MSSPSFLSTPPMPELPTETTVPLRIPRPPNAFILYRSHRRREIRDAILQYGYTTTRASMVSKIAGKLWEAEEEGVRQEFFRRAHEAKEQHMLQHPDYKYTPAQKPHLSERAKMNPAQSTKRNLAESTHPPRTKATKRRIEHKAMVVSALTTSTAPAWLMQQQQQLFPQPAYTAHSLQLGYPPHQSYYMHQPPSNQTAFMPSGISHAVDTGSFPAVPMASAHQMQMHGCFPQIQSQLTYAYTGAAVVVDNSLVEPAVDHTPTSFAYPSSPSSDQATRQPQNTLGLLNSLDELQSLGTPSNPLLDVSHTQNYALDALIDAQSKPL